MAFGQSPGRAASPRQVQQLLGLLEQAGYSDFRSARGPMSLNQRQAGGRFTVEEAETLIEQLENAADDGGAEGAALRNPQPPLSATERTLRAIPAERLAAELSRRGWIVMEP